MAPPRMTSTCSNYDELVLYELLEGSTSVDKWPLGLQELAVYQINSHIEAFWAARGTPHLVSIENDLYVNTQGFGRESSTGVGGGVGGGGELVAATEASLQSGLQVHGVNNSLEHSVELCRRWEKTPLLPLATSRLQIELDGQELVVSCRRAALDVPNWLSLLGFLQCACVSLEIHAVNIVSELHVLCQNLNCCWKGVCRNECESISQMLTLKNQCANSE